MIYVIGSGPASVSACAALVASGNKVTVLDVGNELPASQITLRDRLARVEPEEWASEDIAQLKNATEATTKGVANKLVLGSDFAYRDSKEAAPLSFNSAIMRRSFALGGLSNVWGACIARYPESELKRWPITTSELNKHYDAALKLIPGSQYKTTSNDDKPEAVSRQALILLQALRKNQSQLQAHGVRFGTSRLAVDFHGDQSSQGPCRQCGLCLYGCPYQLIYSASQTLTSLRESGLVQYLRGLRVKRLESRGDATLIVTEDLKSNQTREFTGKRVYVGAGVIETARLMLESMNRQGQSLAIKHSDKFTLPMLQYRATAGVLTERLHTLSQVFLEIDDRELDKNKIHLQAYTYNDLFLRALKRKSGALFPILKFPIRKLLERLVICFGYLHSDISSTVRMKIKSGSNDIELSGEPNPASRHAAKLAARKLRRVHRLLQGVATLPTIGIPGEGNHCGSTFPMSRAPKSMETDPLGRVPGFPRVHLIDASIFPSLSAATITLTSMANAHRIASATADWD